MTVHLMERLVRRIIPDYDLHRRSGFPENIPIPQVDAAEQVYMDMVSEKLLIRFIEVLIDVNQNGYMGRPVTIRLLPQILNELEEVGLSYNEKYGAIVERDRRDVVCLVEPDETGGSTGFAKWVYVRKGLENDSFIEVTPERDRDRLEPGSIVLVDGHTTLKHKLAVLREADFESLKQV